MPDGTTKPKYAPTAFRSWFSMLDKFLLYIVDNWRVGKLQEELVELYQQLPNWENGYIQKHASVFTKEDLLRFLNFPSTPSLLPMQAWAILATGFAARAKEPSRLTKGDLVRKMEDGNAFYEVFYVRSKRRGLQKRDVNDEGKSNVYITGQIEVGILDKLMDTFKNDEPSDSSLFKYLKWTNHDSLEALTKPAFGNIGINVLTLFSKKMAEKLGLPNPQGYTGQCFRSTACTMMADSGFGKDQIKRVSQHRSDTIVEQYIDNSKIQKFTAAAALSVSGSLGHSASSSAKIGTAPDQRKNQTNVNNTYNISFSGNASISSLGINSGANHDENMPEGQANKRARLESL